MKKIVYESDGAGRNLLFTKPSDVIRDVVSLERKGFHVTLAIEEPEICGNIDVAVTAFKANDPDGRAPNLLILGPDEYKQLLGAIQTRSAVRIDVGDYRVETVTKKNYKGMRIIQSTEPGLLVAKEWPFL